MSENQVMNGLVKINPVEWVDVCYKIVENIDGKNKKRRASDELYHQNEIRVRETIFTGYNWSIIPWYVKPIVFVFGNARESFDGMFGRYGYCSFRREVRDGVYLKEEICIRWCEAWFDSYRFKKYLNMDKSSITKKRCLPVDVKYRKCIPYPEHVKSIMNNIECGHDGEMFISLENYNSLCETKKEIEDGKIIKL